MATKLVFVLAICALAAVVCAKELYSDKYDNINIDAILANDSVRNEYYNCMLDFGPCVTPDAAYFKGLLGEIIITNCRKCTDKQRYMFKQVLKHYTLKEPQKWQELVLKVLKELPKLKLL